MTASNSLKLNTVESSELSNIIDLTDKRKEKENTENILAIDEQETIKPSIEHLTVQQKLTENNQETTELEQNKIEEIKIEIKKIPLENGFVFNSLSRRIGTITNPSKPGFRVTYIGFDSESDAFKFIKWLKTEKFTYHYRESERLETLVECKVWGLNPDLILALAKKDILKQQQEQIEQKKLIYLINQPETISLIIQFVICIYYFLECFDFSDSNILFVLLSQLKVKY